MTRVEAELLRRFLTDAHDYRPAEVGRGKVRPVFASWVAVRLQKV